MGKTGIEWTRGPNGEQGYTFSPWIGCTRVSPACDHCYAADVAVKMGVIWDSPPRPVAESTWAGPLAWNRKAESEGVRFRVFSASMADILDKRAFHGDRDRLWKLMEATPNLDWLPLTKRPQLARRYMPPHWFEAGGWPPNVWFGFTGENQDEFDRRAPFVRDIPAPVRFVSVEPMVGPLILPPDIREWLDWVICGGESGRLADIRDTPDEWMGDLQQQCADLHIPFFQKQLPQIRYRGIYKKFELWPGHYQVRQQPTPRISS